MTFYNRVMDWYNGCSSQMLQAKFGKGEVTIQRQAPKCTCLCKFLASMQMRMGPTTPGNNNQTPRILCLQEVGFCMGAGDIACTQIKYPIFSKTSLLAVVFGMQACNTILVLHPCVTLQLK